MSTAPREIQQLRNIAYELGRLQNDAKRIMSDMQTYWEGTAADEFLSANKQWQNDTKVLEDEINAIAKLIQTETTNAAAR